MKETKHSPLPWIYEVFPAGTTIWTDEKGRSREICKVTPRGEMRDSEGEANAAFIVRAVNSHDDLLNALKAVVERLAGWMEIADPDHVNADDRQALAEARAIISKATGESR